MKTSITEFALEKARVIFDGVCSPIGLIASPEGYPHVWARDCVITSLDVLLSHGHEKLPASFLGDAGGSAI